MEISLQLFGAFRDMGHETVLSVADDGSVADLAQAMEKFLIRQDREDLLDTLAVSRFATETKVLPHEAPIGQDRRFALLPPVSGG